jgi:hypothetical protein
MFVLGLLVLLAVGGVAVFRITAGAGGPHSPARPSLLGNCLGGPGSRLFFYGLVLAASAVLRLTRTAVRLASRHGHRTGAGEPAPAPE